MADIVYNEEKGEWEYRQMLRSEAVEAAWRGEPQHVKGLKLGEYVVMPNHFHAIVEYHATGRSGPVGTQYNDEVAPVAPSMQS